MKLSVCDFFSCVCVTSCSTRDADTISGSWTYVHRDIDILLANLTLKLERTDRVWCMHPRTHTRKQTETNWEEEDEPDGNCRDSRQSQPVELISDVQIVYVCAGTRVWAAYCGRWCILYFNKPVYEKDSTLKCRYWLASDNWYVEVLACTDVYRDIYV